MIGCGARKEKEGEFLAGQRFYLLVCQLTSSFDNKLGCFVYKSC